MAIDEPLSRCYTVDEFNRRWLCRTNNFISLLLTEILNRVLFDI